MSRNFRRQPGAVKQKYSPPLRLRAADNFLLGPRTGHGVSVSVLSLKSVRPVLLGSARERELSRTRTSLRWGRARSCHRVVFFPLARNKERLGNRGDIPSPPYRQPAGISLRQRLNLFDLVKCTKHEWRINCFQSQTCFVLTESVWFFFPPKQVEKNKYCKNFFFFQRRWWQAMYHH